MLHILGMDSTLYATWLDSDQNSATYADVYTATTMSAAGYISTNRPSTTQFLITPNVKSWTQTFFNCPSIPGMYL